MVEANKVSQVFWLRRIEKAVVDDPTIKDVCRVCDNGFMSDLDSYICQLFDGQFSIIRQRYEQVRFTYDFHMLKRWMLKMAYNSARIHNARDTFALKAVLPYIRGEDNQLGRSVRMFLQLAHPAPIPPNERAALGGDEVPQIWEPRLNRAGLAIVNIPHLGSKIIRMVSLQSYGFFLAFADPAGGASAGNQFADAFLKRWPNAAEIKASENHVNVICDGSDSWESIKDARRYSLQ
ncbi:hypothetical protein EOA32_34940 [Mesorhizobium sp. M1A.F.Ca.ET.072.01.1.1]|uniref:hypothetical protein n=1 Tax=Mesorhizobium sp. M1A.F.Ca.ET.072.01.1.1 TaxID=2496753 RepID=UPI000FD5000D|nr:hypothetical protein [Mesorhizobium sp. M1A.F.Ca.ET.072.01.1.1]RUW45127.1 hypothetical protein EOA32_34940 [Mesorhizobium sp. M1A.F.Ca.ET.072.01.1.1]TIV04992.1 MAG: hypothetical protein E5W04_00540 [Mesorhizobium sp.]